jgi:hypothetical protein
MPGENPASSIARSVLRQSFDDGPRLALVFDLYLDPFLHFDGVDLWRPLVERPEELVDADVRLDAPIESFEVYGRRGGVLHKISRTRRRKQHGWRGWLWKTVGPSRTVARETGRCCCSRAVQALGAGARR